MSDAISKAFNQLYAPPEGLPADTICRQIRIPNSRYWRAIVDELLSRLGLVESWQEVEGAMEPWEAAAAGARMFHDYVNSRCEVIGELKMHTLNELPDNWLNCDGNTYERADYPQLYDALHPNYQISATQFKVPNMVYRVPMGTIPSFLNEIGTEGGEAQHFLTLAEMPIHNHAPALPNRQFWLYAASGGPAAFNGATGGTFQSTPGGGATTATAGSGQPHNNVQPFHMVHYAIVAK
jgi:microcystin-dependent protein